MMGAVGTRYFSKLTYAIVGTLAVYFVTIFQGVEETLVDVPLFNLGWDRLPTSSEALQWTLVVCAVGIPIGIMGAIYGEATAHRFERNIPVLANEVDFPLFAMAFSGFMLFVATALLMYAIKLPLAVIFVFACVGAIWWSIRYQSAMDGWRYHYPSVQSDVPVSQVRAVASGTSTIDSDANT